MKNCFYWTTCTGTHQNGAVYIENAMETVHVQCITVQVIIGESDRFQLTTHARLASLTMRGNLQPSTQFFNTSTMDH